jgi:hypothetical protein
MSAIASRSASTGSVRAERPGYAWGSRFES